MKKNLGEKKKEKKGNDLCYRLALAQRRARQVKGKRENRYVIKVKVMRLLNVKR